MFLEGEWIASELCLWGMAKRTIDIDRDLADRAAALLGTASLTAMVEGALREVVGRAERRPALEWLKANPFKAEERALMDRASR